MSETEIKLTAKNRAAVTFQALLKGIPYIGDTLEHFIFGPLAELRMKRIERTLTELGEAIRSEGSRARIDTEEFVNLFEKVLPQINRSVNEKRRVLLRNLLINASFSEPGSPEWDEANLAAELVAEIDTPGLEVIAALSKCREQNNFMSSQPSPRIYDGGTEFGKPTDTYYLVNYDWPIVEEWILRLREKRLLWSQTHDARGGFGGLQLTDLGRCLVKWAMSSETQPNAPSLVR
jgi:hypothetical protein